MAEHYLLLKWLHLIGAAILFGTGLGIAFNFWPALRGSSVAALAAAARATVVAGACWIPVVFIQVRLRDLAVASAHANTPLPAQFHRLARRWFLLGWPAFIAVAVIFWLMIARPA